MSRHDPRVRLLHMRDYSQEAIEMASSRTRADLDDNRMFALAMSRLVEMIGEAAAKLSPEERALYPGIPWREIIGMRNRLIHGYEYVDYDVVWDAITTNLPPLLDALREILGDEGEGPTG